MKTVRWLGPGLILALVFQHTIAVTPPRMAEQLADSYLSKTPAGPLPPLTLNQAMQVQANFIAFVKPDLGPVVGYKAGLTNPGAQKRFNVTQPIRGVLLKKMLLKNGAVLPTAFAIRPMGEGDLMVRVGSESINNATSPMDALAALDAVMPFIELPDLVYATDVKVGGPALAAINVGARYGVMGDPIPLKATKAWEKRLANFRLEMLDAGGHSLAKGTGRNLLGHPLNVVLWIKDSLQAEGKLLRRGDLLSLGTVTKLLPVEPHSTIQARYYGLSPDGPVTVSVRFD